jgi:hypothetical protein
MLGEATSTLCAHDVAMGMRTRDVTDVDAAMDDVHSELPSGLFGVGTVARRLFVNNNSSTSTSTTTANDDDDNTASDDGDDAIKQAAIDAVASVFVDSDPWCVPLAFPVDLDRSHIAPVVVHTARAALFHSACFFQEKCASLHLFTLPTPIHLRTQVPPSCRAPPVRHDERRTRVHAAAARAFAVATRASPAVHLRRQRRGDGGGDGRD